ncbi:MAG TPA: hypothetical protein VHW01_21900 [Polyangiaceae bacterium]|jgi:hypothetical protein|nr:hypothetical protein [Polyangiaceae bacterium]
MHTKIARTPTYRSFHSDFSNFGPAEGYTATIEAFPHRSREHFPTVAAARAWAERNARGAHYLIQRETLSSLTVAVGSTCNGEWSWRFAGLTEVSSHKRAARN